MSTSPSSGIALIGPPGDRANDAARFLAQLGLESFMLSVGQGDLAERVDNLEALRGVGYAIVLVPDQAGGEDDALLELGFLLGTLGTQRMCFLAPDGAPPVPGLGSVVRHTMDGEGLWRLLLARALRRAGLEVDMNRAI